MSLSWLVIGVVKWGAGEAKAGEGDPKGNQPRIFIGRTDAEAEAATLWFIVKDLDAGKD